MNPTSSFGPLRDRRHAKSAADTETQHRLWTIRIQEHVAAGLAPRQALEKLRTEAAAWVAEISQRKAERRDAWNAFLRKIPAP